MARTKKLPPNHPDEFLRDEIMPAGGLTQDALARMLDVSGRTVNEIVTEKRRVSANMARRLARAFNTTPELWLGLQQMSISRKRPLRGERTTSKCCDAKENNPNRPGGFGDQSFRCSCS